MKIITCQDCGQEFIFSDQEEEFYNSKNFDAPKRCISCRQIRKERFNNGKESK